MTLPSDDPDLPAHLLSERTHVRLPSKAHWIGATVEWLRQKAMLAGACHESRAGKLLLALHEALSNAIIHGNLGISSELKERGDDAFVQALAERGADPRFAGRGVDVMIECDAARCKWIITDEGPGFNIAAVLARHASDDPEVLLASGRGILIMRSFLDEVRWELGGRRLILGLERASGAEKRQGTRQPIQQALRVAPILPDGSIDWPAAYEAVARDCSEHGVGLLQEQLAHTERVLIGLTFHDQLIYVPAEVRHCRTVAGDVVELGCRFQMHPTQAPSEEGPTDQVQDAITALLERSAPGVPADERRHHPRVAYSERIEIVSPNSAEPHVAYARDLSKGGMAFLTQAPLLGEVVIVLPARAGGEPLRVRSRIVRCTKIIEGFYDVGAEFVNVVRKDVDVP